MNYLVQEDYNWKISSMDINNIRNTVKTIIKKHEKLGSFMLF
ncbi:hypothetical protein [Clostridium carboxidivorans]|nr:hypothetical protein [Clostridium carboxidivorans]